MIRVRCPVCERSLPGPGRAAWPQFPFCSERCRLIDLGRWLGEEYRLKPEPGRQDAVAEEEHPDRP
jgi:hypothetical protein